MKAIFAAVTALAVFGLLAPAIASATIPDDSAFTLDLTAAGKGVYYVKCMNNSKDIASCPSPSLWEESNPVPGLQSTTFTSSGKVYVPDNELVA